MEKYVLYTSLLAVAAYNSGCVPRVEADLSGDPELERIVDDLTELDYKDLGANFQLNFSKDQVFDGLGNKVKDWLYLDVSAEFYLGELLHGEPNIYDFFHTGRYNSAEHGEERMLAHLGIPEEWDLVPHEQKKKFGGLFGLLSLYKNQAFQTNEEQLIEFPLCTTDDINYMVEVCNEWDYSCFTVRSDDNEDQDPLIIVPDQVRLALINEACNVSEEELEELEEDSLRPFVKIPLEEEEEEVRETWLQEA